MGYKPTIRVFQEVHRFGSLESGVEKAGSVGGRRYRSYGMLFCDTHIFVVNNAFSCYCLVWWLFVLLLPTIII